MSEESTFMDELLAESELQEERQSEAYFDLLLLQIKALQEKIASNFAEAEKEIQVIKSWALNRNHGLQVKIDFIEKKLEMYIRDRNEKTIDLPNGTLRFYKKPDKVEVTDVELFLKHAKPEMLTVIPETVKPDIAGIKAYIKGHKTPAGVTVIEGKAEFSYKLNNGKDNDNGGQEEAGDSAEPAYENRTAV